MRRSNNRAAAAAPAGVLLVLTLMIAWVLAQTGAAQPERAPAHQASSKAKHAGNPKCWGAASRDPQHPCHNKALDDVVYPTPADALLMPEGHCYGEMTVNGLDMCRFGISPAKATAAVALIGDSHAAAWRPALDDVARNNHWNGYSVIHNGCGFTEALAQTDPAFAQECVAWTHAVIAWLQQHPEVTTLVISGLDTRRFTTSSDAGFHQAWSEVPPSVKNIFVIRDVPHDQGNSRDCIDRALARHQPAYLRCAHARSRSLDVDQEANAAVDAGSPRVHAMNFTPFFCDKHLCYPVVGGVLVHVDLTHMTGVFDETLGPYLQRGMQQLTAHKGRSPGP